MLILTCNVVNVNIKNEGKKQAIVTAIWYSNNGLAGTYY